MYTLYDNLKPIDLVKDDTSIEIDVYSGNWNTVCVLAWILDQEISNTCCNHSIYASKLCFDFSSFTYIDVWEHNFELFFAYPGKSPKTMFFLVFFWIIMRFGPILGLCCESGTMSVATQEAHSQERSLFAHVVQRKGPNIDSRKRSVNDQKKIKHQFADF